MRLEKSPLVYSKRLQKRPEEQWATIKELCTVVVTRKSTTIACSNLCNEKTPLATDDRQQLPLQLVQDGPPDPPGLRPLRPARLGLLLV